MHNCSYNWYLPNCTVKAYSGLGQAFSKGIGPRGLPLCTSDETGLICLKNASKPRLRAVVDVIKLFLEEI